MTISRHVARVMTLVALLVAIAVEATSASSAGTSAGDVVLVGGTLVDVERGELIEATLWIRDGVIAALGDEAPHGFTGETVDVRGQWVVPGLRDMHVHAVMNQGFGAQEMLGPAKISRRSLYAGVAGFLDLLNTENFIFRVRDRQRTGAETLGADIFAAGAVIAAPGGHGTEYPAPAREVTNPKQARQQVKDLVTKQPDVVKIIHDRLTPEQQGKSWRQPRPSIDEATLTDAIKAAIRAGVPTVVHVRTWENVTDAVNAGATAVTHLPSTAIPDEVVELLASEGTVVIPTLSVADPSLVTHPELLESPLLRRLTTEAVLATYRDFDRESNGMVNGLTEAMTHRFDALRRLSAAGVELVAGTDAGNVLTVHGYSLHRELALMVDAGLSPWDVLASATVKAGDLLGKRWGLSKGSEGTVVVLGKSPIEDIRNTETIQLVIQRGVVIDREALLDS